AAHRHGAFHEACSAPLLEGGSHLVEDLVDLSPAELVKTREHFLGRRINGLDGHEHILLPIVCLPPTAYRLPPTAYRLPPTAYRLSPIAYRLSPTRAYRHPDQILQRAHHGRIVAAPVALSAGALVHLPGH